MVDGQKENCGGDSHETSVTEQLVQEDRSDYKLCIDTCKVSEVCICFSCWATVESPPHGASMSENDHEAELER